MVIGANVDLMRSHGRYSVDGPVEIELAFVSQLQQRECDE